MAVDIKVAIKEFFMSEVNQRNEQTHGVEGSSSTIFTNYRIKFRKEAQNLASLHHPHIVQVTDVFDENNTTYYVMQYIEGMSLDSFIASKGRVSAEDTILIAAQIGQALSYMHQRHMLHLDLKPGNIMLDKQGQVHLIDFGLSSNTTVMVSLSRAPLSAWAPLAMLLSSRPTAWDRANSFRPPSMCMPLVPPCIRCSQVVAPMMPR